jgi:hypothetical protein
MKEGWFASRRPTTTSNRRSRGSICMRTCDTQKGVFHIYLFLFLCILYVYYMSIVLRLYVYYMSIV